MLDRTKNYSRQSLAEAIAAKQAARSTLAQASKAAKNAKELLDASEADVLAHEGLDDQITEYRTQAIRMWSVNGGGSKRPSMDLSDKLNESHRKRQDANDRFKAATVAYELLSAERAFALQAFSAADSAVASAADRVMIEDAQELAEELEREQALVDALRIRLRAIMAIQRTRPGWTVANASVHQSPYVPLINSLRLRKLSEYPGEPPYHPMIYPEGQEKLNWEAYHQRLLTTPDWCSISRPHDGRAPDPGFLGRGDVSRQERR